MSCNCHGLGRKLTPAIGDFLIDKATGLGLDEKTIKVHGF